MKSPMDEDLFQQPLTQAPKHFHESIPSMGVPLVGNSLLNTFYLSIKYTNIFSKLCSAV